MFKKGNVANGGPLTWLPGKMDFEDVFPIEDGDVPASHVSLPECIVFCSYVYLHVFFSVRLFERPKLESNGQPYFSTRQE